MPTNLKSLLSRSRSRNELKLREKEENCCEQSTNGSNEGGIGGSSGLGPGPACANGNSSKSSFVGYQCQCTCHRTSGDVCSLSQNKSGGSGSGSGESASGMRKDASCKTLFFSCGTLNGVGDVGIFESGVLCSASGSSSSGLGASGSTASTTHHQDPYSSPSHQSLSMMRKCETVLALSTLAGSVPPGLGTTAAAAQTPISPSHSFTTTSSSGSACVSNCPSPATATAASAPANANNTITHHNSNSNSTSANNSNATKVSRVMKDKIFSTSSSTLNCLLHSSKTTSKLFSGWKLSSSSNANNSANAGGSGSTPYSSSSSSSGAGGSNSTSGGGNNGSPGASDNLSDQYSRANGNSQNSINFSCINTISSSPAATSICQKSRSQLSVSTEAPNGSGLGGSGAPLTPINRLRRNISVNNTNALCPNSLTNSTYSRSSSVTSFVWNKEDQQLQEILCRLCLCNVSFEDTVEILACACRYCKDCVVAYVSFEIQEGAYDIACPDASCEKQGVLVSAEIENLVSATLMEKYRKFRMYREVEKDGQLMWCPSPGCETVCRIQETSGLSSGSDSKARSGGSSRSCSLPNISCTTCHKSYCAECKLSWHPDTSCEAFRRKLVKQGKLNLDDEDLFSLESIKKCPFCHVPIEKDSGCAQMMCKRCKHVFCWYCLASLDDDFLLRHYDKGPCKNKLGHSRASVVWHRAQVIGIFAGFGVLVLLASPLLILAAPCLLCCRCRYCANKLDPDESPVPV